MGTILVTGADGFVGAHLLRALADDGSVVAWRRPKAPPSAPVAGGRASGTQPPGVGTPVRWANVDILDRTAVADAIAEQAPSQIFHLAGAAGVRDSWSDTTTPLSVNVRGTQHLLEAVADAGLAARVLIPGSALIYKPSARAIREDDPVGPVSPYGVSKLAQEMLGRQCAASGMAVIITRSFTHLGPGQGLGYAASSFANQIARIEAGLIPPVIDVGSLDAERDLTDVRDTVRAYVALMARAQPGRPYNVCSGTAHRIRAVLDGLLGQATVDVTIRTDPARLRPRDNDRLLGDASRIVTEIGWRPRIPLDTTLRDLLDYWRRDVRRQTPSREPG